MPRTSKAASLILFAITPRFEIFYALQALGETARPGRESWKRETSRQLPRNLKPVLQRLAPLPLIWPLLADSLQSAPPMVQFGGMIDELRAMQDPTFQRAVLGGAFKDSTSVDGLVSGKSTLAEVVATKSESQRQLLSLLGLLPFRKNSPSVHAFERIVNEPSAYRKELAGAVEAFWTFSFAETWESMKPKLLDAGDRLEAVLSNSSLDEFARLTQLPIRVEQDSVAYVRGAARVSLELVEGIHIIPSAFNAGRFWTAYTNPAGRTRFFIPLFDPDLAPDEAEMPDPSQSFRALGDTTRYAIASVIARTPMTSVDLARAFGVSKPTISHHVQLLRLAKLLNETSTEHGVVLSLNRAALERISGDAATEMFSDTGAAPALRRTRK